MLILDEDASCLALKSGAAYSLCILWPYLNYVCGPERGSAPCGSAITLHGSGNINTLLDS